MKLKKKLLPADQRKSKPQDESALGFGKLFADHMLCMDYKEGQGWHDMRIIPHGPFSLDPAALVFHYGQETFEGLKAYYSTVGKIAMFRPTANLARMNSSNRRVCIPDIPEGEVLEGMMELVRTDRDWVPKSEGTSLYIRPTIIATEAHLGVAASSEYLFFIIMGPVGAYYPEGFNPTRIYVEEEYVRAAAGGTGSVKTGGNYAASLLAAQRAYAKGFTQVLWLDACDRKTIEEVGTSNMFFVIDDEVVTAPLGGSILPGITRDSVLTLCNDLGIEASERKITIDELIAAQKDGRLQEAFGTGTAAVISPVGSFHYQGVEFTVGGGQTGEISRRLYDELTGIQLGRQEDRHGWVVKLG